MNAVLDTAVRLMYPVNRWMYRGGHPNALARFLNKLGALQYAKGFLSPTYAVTLHVKGRSSGRSISFPLVLVERDGQEYLVSMLGNDANWVRNVRADGGQAVLERGTRRHVVLEDVDVASRAPILRDYLAVAPGGRAHFPIDRHSPIAEFEKIADRYPVFVVRPAT
jgi:deazaflavin-dependent oxidoreductase (nitroreductase family)